jgi:hypothetical protein
MSPIVLTLNDVHICETGNYPDKFGQIHRYQLFQWVNNFTEYIPVLLEHQPITCSFFGYVFDLRVEGEKLLSTIALTKYGVQALYDYRERHMGSGWSVGIGLGKQNLVEVTLCKVPRVSSTHMVTLEGVRLTADDVQKYTNMYAGNAETAKIDELVVIIRDIVHHESNGNEPKMIESMQRLKEFVCRNQIAIPGAFDSDEEGA